MDENTLLFEIGSEALDDLTSTEKAAVLAAYSNAQVKLAGMKVFSLLSKKFQPTYKMGRMYENLAQKYEHYDKLYRRYAASTSAGKLGHTDIDDQKVVERNKFVTPHEDIGDL